MFSIFSHKILLLYEKDSVKAWYVNWKNIVVVFCLWILICVAMMRGIKKIKWVNTESKYNIIKLIVKLLVSNCFLYN